MNRSILSCQSVANAPAHPSPLTARPVPHTLESPYRGTLGIEGPLAEWQGWAAAASTELASVAGPAEVVDSITDESPGLTMLQDWLVGEEYLVTAEKHQSLFPGHRCVQLVFLGPIRTGETVGDNLTCFMI